MDGYSIRMMLLKTSIMHTCSMASKETPFAQRGVYRMIPDLFHRIWLGKAAIPYEYNEYWERLNNQHPEWFFMTWTEEEIDWIDLTDENRQIYETSKTYSEKSDVLRFAILKKFGGIYLDTDVEPLKNFAPLLASKAFAGWEYDHKLCTAVLGAEAESEPVCVLVERMPEWVAKHQDDIAAVRTGPAFLTACWWKRTDVTRLPRDAFYPYGWWPGEEAKHQYFLEHGYPQESYAVHHWAASWVEK